jgi:antitoxin (DNA-binding transcriptional repressor) of toxin-antitoxin stability system
MCTPKYTSYTGKGDIMETKVGVKEFRANLPSYLESASPLVITRHGETIGYYIPARHDRTQMEFDALKQAVEKLQAMMSALDVSEDDIVAEFKALRATEKQ